MELRREMKKRVLIVGSGVVGRGTGKVLAGKGFRVTFTDVDPLVVSQLREEGHEAFGVDQLEKPDADIFVLSVPTYVSQYDNGGPESIKMASASVGEWLSKTSRYCLVVVRSTVLPGTTEETIIPILEKYSGMTAGRDFGICVNPEYLRERHAEEDSANPWIVVIGELDKKSGDLLQEIYHWVDCPIYRISLEGAEMQKFVHNLCNANKISFFNEIRVACQRIGLDSEQIFRLVAQSAEALWSPLYGTKDLGPFGGSCLPKDTAAFLSWAKERGIATPLVSTVLKVNEAFIKMNITRPR